MKPSIARELRKRKRRIEARLRQREMEPQDKPAFAASNIEYDVSGRSNGLAAGGIGAMHLMVRRLGLVEAIDRRISVLKLHRPYQESDHVLNIAFNVLAGNTLHRSATPARTSIRSIFGVHPLEQFTYAAGRNKAMELRPVSARMGLPAQQWSFLLQEFAQMLAVDQACEQAMSNLGQILGGQFSVDTAEQVNGHMGSTAGSFLADLPTPEPGSEAKLLVASADCKGVPLVKEDAAKVAAFEVSKKNPGNRRMATVASVYTVDPHIRTAEDITAALFRDEPEAEAVKVKRPKPQNKNTTAHFPRTEDDGLGGAFAISGIHVAMAWIIGQVALRRRSGHVLIALLDGQENRWETMKLHLSFGVRTVPILDIIHALAYVWEADGLFEKADAARKAFIRACLLRILRGEVRGVSRACLCDRRKSPNPPPHMCRC